MCRTVTNMLLAALLFCSASAFAERADRDKPMHLEADRVLVDEAKQRSVFEGQVRLTQGTLLIQAEKIEVAEDAQGFQRLYATGSPAKFWQRYEGSNEYAEGYGERIDYDTRAGSVEFYGQARVKRGQDEVSGAHISYSTKTEVFEVHGNAGAGGSGKSADSRVRAVIQPRNGAADSRTEKSDPLFIQPSSTLTPSEKDAPQHE